MVPVKKINFGIFLNFGFISSPPTANDTQNDATSYKNGKGKKSNTRIKFGNQQKKCLEQIDPGDVKIIGVYDEELK